LHTCALLEDKSVTCWGSNEYGQIGNGAQAELSAPAAVSGLGNVVSVAAGTYHTCALDDVGTAHCWGRGDHGRLGLGDEELQTTPEPASTVASFAAIGAGNAHTCAVTDDQLAYCWGSNSQSQLGDVGQATHRTSPTHIFNITAPGN